MPNRASKRGRGGPTAGKGPGAGRVAREASSLPEAEASGFTGGRYDPLLSFQQAQAQLSDAAFQQDLNPYFPPPGKMLLPPLPRGQGTYSASSKGEKFRTSHACNTCRKAKAKCSGGAPCDKCRNEDRDCVYGDGKRDKEKKEMERLVDQNRKMAHQREQLASTLWKFASDLTPNKKRELEEIMMSPKFLIEDDDDRITGNSPERRESETQGSTDHGEDEVYAEVGSAGSLDVINEDTNRDENTRTAGFMGKSSAVTWVQRAKTAAADDLASNRNPHRGIGNAARGSFTEASYHVGPSGATTVDADEVNPYEWPTPRVAKALVDLYFEHVHGAFPILCKQDFYAVFDSYPRSEISEEDHTWLSLVNIVFALGAVFAHMTLADFRGDERDHHVYYARARALGIDERSLTQDPELQHTSCLGLLGLYLLAADQFNRSWTVCGIALRHAMALGLHVRSEAEELSDMDKELRVRLWWSLYCLESLLDELTGRPSCISDRDISTPLPINVGEADFRRDRSLYESRADLGSPGRGKAKFSQAGLPTPVESTNPSKVPSQQSASPMASPPPASFTFPMTRLPVTSSTYFIYRVRLSIISHEILTQLYSASLVKASWGVVQEAIRKIEARLLQWKSSLPEELDFFAKSSNQNEENILHRTSLEMFYNSSRMILFRPCLCQGEIERQSDRSKSFDASAAMTCVLSARNIIAALPSIEEARKVYKITAWWNIVHHIIEAASVLMLELAYRSEHLPSQAENILMDSKTAVMWLRALSDQSIAARKGWEIFDKLLNLVAPKVGGNTKNMPSTAPEPPGWKRSSAEGTSREAHGNKHGQERQNYISDPSGMSTWIDQSTYAAQQAYSAPAPLQMDISTSESGVPTNFLAPLYPFNHIYGRYDAYPPSTNPFFPTTTYPSTTGLPVESLGALTSQIEMMEPYQYQVTGGFPGNKYEPSVNHEQDYDMTEYHSWGGDTGGENQDRYDGGHPQE